MPRASQSKSILTQLSTFKTPIGWFGVLHDGPTLCGLKFGFSTRSELVGKFTESLDRSGQSDWASPKFKTSFDGFSNEQYFWHDLLIDYGAGKQVSFADIKINDTGRTEFRARVLKKCRKLPYGSTMSYGELAIKSGYPNAARAVGTTMKSNRFPIIIPCHRVVASTGIGGFSASDGPSTKRRLLAMEGYFEKCEVGS